MVQVHRSGSIVSIPRKLSHHVPIVPIIESQDFEKKLNVDYHSMDSEEFKLYKTANVEEYNLINSADFEIVGKPKLQPKKKSKNPTEDDVDDLSQKLGAKSLELMEEILRQGISAEDMPEAILSMANKVNIISSLTFGNFRVFKIKSSQPNHRFFLTQLI